MMSSQGSSLAGKLSKVLWALPGRFSIAKVLGLDYGLRCVLFHDINDGDTDFTRGLDVSMSPEVFASRIRFLKQHYQPVDLDQVLAAAEGEPLPERALLVTFDDAYASVARVAAPLLAEEGVPAVFFINAGFIDGKELSLDNLLCHTINTLGTEVLDRAAQRIHPGEPPFRGLTHVIQDFTSRLDAEERWRFQAAILEQLEHDPAELAREQGMYMTRAELCSLAEHGIELGNHTRNHVWCRTLDQAGYEEQFQAGCRELEELSGRTVRSFSVPYGMAADLTDEGSRFLLASGHRAIFLVEGLTNGKRASLERLHRVSLKASQDSGSFAELEVMPRLRRLRNAMRGSGR